MKNLNIIPVWQPQGYSTHIIAKNLSKKLGKKTSHTGTLDPMAEGVIIVLSGENRKMKYEYAKWLKEYEFDIVFGITTDTGDGLGVLQIQDMSTLKTKVFPQEIKASLERLIGKYSQTVPAYSAIKAKGKPLHWYARNNKLSEIEIPTRNGEIIELELISLKEIPFSKLLAENLIKISNVTGDLRQEKITESWNEFARSNEKILNETTFQIAKIKTKITKGLYVRSLTQDITQKLEIIAFTNSIIRTKNGNYAKENSYTLDQIFGQDFEKDYDFVSRNLKY